VDTTFPSPRTFNASESDDSSSNAIINNNQPSKDDDDDDDASYGRMPATEFKGADSPLNLNDVQEVIVVEADAEEDSIVDREKWKCKRERDKYEEGINFYRIGMKVELEWLLESIVCTGCFRYFNEA
jgi:hypothetical protein